MLLENKQIKLDESGKIKWREIWIEYLLKYFLKSLKSM